MSSQPFTAAALRGAVDLSALKRPPTPPGGAPGRPAAGAGGSAGGAGVEGAPASAEAGDGLVISGTDANFTAVVNGSMTVPAVVVLWSARLPESGDFADVLALLARSYAGRFRLVSIDVDANPGLLRAFQVQSVPATLGLVQGQPVPLFAGVQTEANIRTYLDELLALALSNGVTGRVPVADEVAAGPAETEPELMPELSPLHGAAFDAIDRGDFAGARAAYEQALREDPADLDAKLGLAQVELMQRTDGVDPTAARTAADAAPNDVGAQTLVADLDLLDGSVEAAFTRLVDTVRECAGDDRNLARQHLLDLFELVGPDDERVVAARRALMSALF